MLTKVPVVSSRNNELCDRCESDKVDFWPFHAHADICEYTYFVRKVAPAQNLESLNPIVDAETNGIDLMRMLDACGIKYVAYELHSPINRGHQIFVDKAVAEAISVYDQKEEAFAGMDLPEYLQRMFGTPE